MGRIDEVAELPTEDAGGRPALASIAQPALPSEPASATGPLVAFDSVSFRYRSDGPSVLEEVSFDVAARGLTALVGPSGAGKTTLFALLERFYELQAGRSPSRAATSPIGREPRCARRWATWSRTHRCSPEPCATTSSTRHPTRPRRACSRRSARRGWRIWWRAFPKGSIRHSAHAARRCRAESASGSRSLGRWFADRRCSCSTRRPLSSTRSTSWPCATRVARAGRRAAVLAIAHRLSTVVAAHRIVVLERGRVRAVGTHAELVRRDELYAGLAATQFSQS